MEFQFKKKHPDVEIRKNKCKELMKKNDKQIPIILEKDSTFQYLDNYKSRYLINKDFTISQFIYLVRTKFNIPEEQAIFLSAKGKYHLSGERIMSDIYERFKDKEDGFLYIIMSKQEIYG